MPDALSDAPLHLRFDATTHPDPVARTEAWHEALSLCVDVVFTPAQRAAFAGSLSFYPLGSAVLVDARFTAHTMVRDQTTIARSGAAHVVLDLFTEGGLSGVFGARALTIGLGEGFLLDFRRTLRVSVQAGRFIGFVVPRAALEARMDKPRALHGTRFCAKRPEAALLGSMLEQLVIQAPRLTPARAAALGHAVTGLIAGCVSEGTPAADQPAAAEPDLVRVQRHIARHAADSDLDPDALARAFGLSRTGLYRLFRYEGVGSPEGGVAEAIRRRRAEIARGLLGQDEHAGTPVAAIARASGFADARTLSRALRDIYGASPSELRRARSDATEDGSSGTIGAMLDAITPSGQPR